MLALPIIDSPMLTLTMTDECFERLLCRRTTVGRNVLTPPHLTRLRRVEGNAPYRLAGTLALPIINGPMLAVPAFAWRRGRLRG
jgi:hypothetical protein